MNRSTEVNRRFYGLILVVALILISYWNILDVPVVLPWGEVVPLRPISLFETQWLYFIALAVSVLPVIALSFHPRLYFFDKWKYALLSALLVSLGFVPWDILFTRLSVWGFNQDYHTSLNLFNLPLEEILFFLVIPFCCLFIYENVNKNKKVRIPYNAVNLQTTFFIVLGILLLVSFPQNWYTSSVAMLTMCLASGLRATIPRNRLIIYYHAYFWSLIPFVLINGILTGMFSIDPVVLYNPAEQTGVRFWTIPIEDSLYSYGLLMLNFFVYDKLVKR